MSNSHTVALERLHKNADGRKEEIATQDAVIKLLVMLPFAHCVCVI